MFAAISFPGLGLELSPSRIAFSLFGKTVTWYGIILALAFLAAAIYAIRRSPKFGITQDDLIDIITISTPVAIIGARLYYVACQWENYADDPISILYVWKGGVAIYGGIIGGILAALIVTTIKRIRFSACLDVVGPAFLIGQAIGRWGNFINREAYGSVTDLPWRMVLSVNGAVQYVHPTFLYESLWNLCGFLLIHIFPKDENTTGRCSCGM
jgi:phosphatidylglycerol:prolipoprotein diacylglycerol transferase